MASFWKTLTKSSSNTPSAPDTPLRLQFPTPASPDTKIRLAVLSTALLDALGAPVENCERFSFPFITKMQPKRVNDRIVHEPGVWTDDTSTMLCLANSLATLKDSPNFVGGFDEVHQLRLYRRWVREGYLSCTGRCFHVGTELKTALSIFTQHEHDPDMALHRIRQDLGGDNIIGNGSLMRIIPIGLAYWHDDAEAMSYAKRCSLSSHPNKVCYEACQMWTGAVARIMQEVTQAPRRNRSDDDRLSKLDLLEYISNHPYQDDRLRRWLCLPFGIPPRPAGKAEREEYYYRHHPLLRLIAETQGPGASGFKPDGFAYYIPTAEQLPSTNSVVDTVASALYCFFTTKTFEDGALMAVNLGYDADTVGAVYGGLAACWYAAEEGKAEGIFWSKRVRDWRNTVARPDLINEVAANLVIWERKVAEMYQ